MTDHVRADGYYAIIPEWVLDAEISDRAVRLYGVLRRYADHRTLQATPSRRTLADRLHVADVKAVGRALSDLEHIGAVTVTRRLTEAGDRDSNSYLLHSTPWGRGSSAPTPGPDNPDDLRTPEGGRGSSAPRWGQERGGVGVLEPLPVGAAAPPRVGAPAPHKPQPEEPQPQHPLPLPLGLPASNGNGRRPQPAGRFEEFWAAYPKKVGKDAARRAWDKAARRADPDKIIDVVQRYPWRSERQFVKDPATWLNAGCWEDDLDSVAAMNGSGRRSGSLAAPLPARDSYTYGDGKF